MKEFIEKLKVRLKKCSFSIDDSSHTIDIDVVDYNDAVEIIDELAEEYNNGWIACSERLPEEGVDVLVWFEYYRYGSYNRLYQTVGISYTYHGDWSGFVNGSSGWKQLRIIAWQPLPEPYKEGGTV